MKKELPDRYCFPATFYHEDSDGYSVIFPDLDGLGGNAQGKGFEEARKNAREVLELVLYWAEKEGGVPAPSAPEKIKVLANAVLMMIDVYMPAVRGEKDRKIVNVNCTMPNWLKQAAIAANINFSDALQNSLKRILEIKENKEKRSDEEAATTKAKI